MALVEGAPPPRPALSLPVFVFIGFWAGLAIALGFSLDAWCGIEWRLIRGLSSVGWISLGVVAVLVGGLLLLVSRQRTSIALLLIGCLCGVLCANAATVRLKGAIDRVAQTQRHTFEVQAIEEATTSLFGAQQVVRISSGLGKGLKVQLRYDHKMQPLELGQHAWISEILLPIPLAESLRFLLSKEVVGQTSVSSFENRHYGGLFGWLYRYRAELVLQNSALGSAGALTRGVLLGDKRGFSPQMQDDFARAGLSHVLAVSGTHLAIVAGCVLGCLSFFGLKRSHAQIGMVIVCLGYVLLTGNSPSAVRALGMLVVYSCSIWLFRRRDLLNSLALTALICLVAVPFWAISVSFSLSVCAVAGIGLFAQYVAWYGASLFPYLPRYLSTSFSLSLVALAATLPLVSIQFGYISLVSPFSNVVISILVMFILPLSMAGAALGWVAPAFSKAIFTTCARLNDITGAIVQWFANLRWATLPVGGGWWLVWAVAGIAVVLWWWWPRPRRSTFKRFGQVLVAAVVVGSLAGAVLLVFPFGSLSGSRIVVLDVGQGDAVLVQSGGNAILVDAGPDPVALNRQLRSHGVKHLDALVFSHDHDDHVAGAQGLVGRYRIDTILCAEGAQESLVLKKLADEFEASLLALPAGSSLNVADIRIEVWGPNLSVIDPSANESCLILYASTRLSPKARWWQQVIRWVRPASVLQASSLLMSGDGEAESIKAALLDSRRRMQPVEVLKVGHHGSGASVDEELLALIHPKYAIISVGAHNRYGHPVPSVVDMLRRHVTRVMRTDIQGSISIELVGAR